MYKVIEDLNVTPMHNSLPKHSHARPDNFMPVPHERLMQMKADNRQAKKAPALDRFTSKMEA